MKNFEKTRVKTAVHRIYELFRPHLGKQKRPLIYATAVIKELSGSYPTLLKARRMLGIKSKKVAGRFCWTYPKCTPDEALGKVKKILYICRNHGCPAESQRFEVESGTKKIRCPWCKGANNEATLVYSKQVQMFMNVMRGHNYDAHISLLRPEFRTTGSKFAIIKKEIGIDRYRDEDGEWHWYWVAPEVSEWVEEYFTTHHHVEIQAFISKAWKEKQWSRALIWRAVLRVGSIEARVINGKKCWIDEANYRPPASRTTAFEEADSPGSLITSDVPHIPDANLDWMPPTAGGRRVRWFNLRKKASRDASCRDDFDRYSQQMQKRYVHEYKLLRGQSERRQPLHDQIARLTELIDQQAQEIAALKEKQQ